MPLKIHRGLDQIGGCITEIWTDNSRVFIDFGQNLPGVGVKTTFDEDRKMVEEIFAENPKKHTAVFYTHAHEDHVGLFHHIPSGVKQYIGEGAKEILLAKYKLIEKGHEFSGVATDEQLLEDDRKIKILRRFKTWERTKPRCKPKYLEVGDIRITPFFNSHSIYDSYMFLIEADGKRIWHTGDYRSHGYRGGGLFPTLRKYATDIDILITEGTMLNRTDTCLHESDITSKMSHVMKAFRYVVVLTSSTDIDRLHSINVATYLSGRDFYICSGYMKETMKIFTRREGEASRGFYEFHPNYALPYDLKTLQKMQKGFCLATGVSQLETVKSLIADLDPSELLLIYSTWDGYYKQPEQVEANTAYKQFRDTFTNVVDIHTSGHADRATIKKVIETINPKQVICIHKEAGAEI